MRPLSKIIIKTGVCAVLIAAAVLTSCSTESSTGEEDQPPPPVMVPVIPNESVVTATIIAINSIEGPLPWELVIEITNAEDVAEYHNLLKERIGQTIAVKTEENMATFQKGDIISAHVKYEGDERSRFYYANEITHSINR